MANAYYGKNIIGELSDAQTLPNNTSVDSTNMVFIAGPVNGDLWIDVYANTAISIADTKALIVELEGYTADTAASATAPFSSANSGAINQLVAGNGTVLANSASAYRILDGLASGGAMAWSAGDLITQCAIPEDLMRALAYDYVQLKYTTTADESSEKVDAFVYVKGA